MPDTSNTIVVSGTSMETRPLSPDEPISSGATIVVPPQPISSNSTPNLLIAKPVSAEPPKKLSEEEIREKIKEDFKKRYLKKYDLEGIDLEAELQKIQKKESHLSRSRREAVVAFFAIFPIEPKEDVKPSKEVKEENSDEHNA